MGLVGMLPGLFTRLGGFVSGVIVFVGEVGVLKVSRLVVKYLNSCGWVIPNWFV